MLYSRPIPPLLCLTVHLAGRVGMPVLKPRQRMYNPLLVLLHKHLRKGTWTERTILTTSGSLLLVVGGKL